MLKEIRKWFACEYLLEQYEHSRRNLRSLLQEYAQGTGGMEKKQEIERALDRVEAAAKAYGSAKYYSYDRDGNFEELIYTGKDTFTGGVVSVSLYNVFLREVTEYLAKEREAFLQEN